MKKLRRLLCIIICFSLLFSLSTPSFAASKAQSKMVKLTAYEGNVEVKKGTTKLSKLTAGMRIFDGYRILTASKSYAFLELDDSKFVKIDQNSDIKIKKNGKKNELLINSGALFFNVKKPLEKNETMKVRTSNMTMGVRGTSGTVATRPMYEDGGELKSVQIEVQIYTGSGYVTWQNVESGKKGEHEVKPGNAITMSVDMGNGSVTTHQRELDPKGTDIPSVALAELTKLPDVVEQMRTLTNFDASSLEETLRVNTDKENVQAEKNEQMRQKAIDNFDHLVSNNVVFGENISAANKENQGEATESTKPPSNGNSGSSGGNNGGNTPVDPDVLARIAFLKEVEANRIPGAPEKTVTISGGNITLLEDLELYRVTLIIAEDGKLDTSKVKFSNTENGVHFDKETGEVHGKTVNYGTLILGECGFNYLENKGNLVVEQGENWFETLVISNGSFTNKGSINGSLIQLTGANSFENSGKIQSPISIEGSNSHSIRFKNRSTGNIDSIQNNAENITFYITNEGAISHIVHNKGKMIIDNRNGVISTLTSDGGTLQDLLFSSDTGHLEHVVFLDNEGMDSSPNVNIIYHWDEDGNGWKEEENPAPETGIKERFLKDVEANRIPGAEEKEVYVSGGAIVLEEDLELYNVILHISEDGELDTRNVKFTNTGTISNDGILCLGDCQLHNLMSTGSLTIEGEKNQFYNIDIYAGSLLNRGKISSNKVNLTSATMENNGTIDHVTFDKMASNLMIYNTHNARIDEIHNNSSNSAISIVNRGIITEIMHNSSSMVINNKNGIIEKLYSNSMNISGISFLEDVGKVENTIFLDKNDHIVEAELDTVYTWDGEMQAWRGRQKDAMEARNDFLENVQSNTVPNAKAKVVLVTERVAALEEDLVLYNVELLIGDQGELDTKNVHFSNTGFVTNYGVFHLKDCDIEHFINVGNLIIEDGNNRFGKLFLDGGNFVNKSKLNTSSIKVGKIESFENSGDINLLSINKIGAIFSIFNKENATIQTLQNNSLRSEITIVNEGDVKELIHNKGDMRINNRGVLQRLGADYDYSQKLLFRESTGTIEEAIFLDIDGNPIDPMVDTTYHWNHVNNGWVSNGDVSRK